MLNRCISLFLSVSFFITLFCGFSKAYAMPLTASSAALIVAETNEILYSLNANEKRGIASTTKIMTAIVAIENGDLNSTVEVKKEDIEVEGTSMGLKIGDKVNLRTLLYGLLLQSGNDAANVIATEVGGSKDNFALMMNKKAKEIGMLSTHFMNPSGLTEDNHYSTAYDMALLGSYAIKNSTFRRICKAKSIRVSYDSPKIERTFYNHNKFLKLYEGATGIKTGFTRKSGRCLVTSATRDNVTLVAVTLNDSNDWLDHERLMDFGFKNIKREKVIIPDNKLNVRVVGSEKHSIKLKLCNEPLVPYYRSKLCYTVEFYKPRFIYSNYRKNDVIGWIEVKDKKHRTILKCNLVADENAS